MRLKHFNQDNDGQAATLGPADISTPARIPTIFPKISAFGRDNGCRLRGKRDK